MTEPPTKRTVRVPAAGLLRWLPQAEQDGLLDERPVVTETAQSSEVQGSAFGWVAGRQKVARLNTLPLQNGAQDALSLLRRAIFTHPNCRVYRSDDYQSEACADSAEADSSR